MLPFQGTIGGGGWMIIGIDDAQITVPADAVADAVNPSR
jgi:hypothetical protein